MKTTRRFEKTKRFDPNAEPKAKAILEGICKHLGYELRDVPDHPCIRGEDEHSTAHDIFILRSPKTIPYGIVESVSDAMPGIQENVLYQTLLLALVKHRWVIGFDGSRCKWVWYDGKSVDEIDINLTLQGMNFTV